jgi:16S rRNA (adenine1518-N6/adenine1519-N6)-dimethyltransferase
MSAVQPKKHLGQHFLTSESIARDTVKSLTASGYSKVLEIGPGMGVLTTYLLEETRFETSAIEIDSESVVYLKKKFPQLKERIIEDDFLAMDLKKYFRDEPFAVIGNFPYNISSQILFKIIEHKNQIPEVVGMFQKEVAQRVASPAGNKNYGILSVLLQAWYDIDYLFTVNENVFNPPPKVKSAVIRLRRNKTKQLNCNEVLFKKIVKAGFNQRRKMLRNSIQQFIPKGTELATNKFSTLRPEQLSVSDFVELANLISATEK